MREVILISGEWVTSAAAPWRRFWCFLIADVFTNMWSGGVRSLVTVLVSGIIILVVEILYLSEMAFMCQARKFFIKCMKVPLVDL